MKYPYIAGGRINFGPAITKRDVEPFCKDCVLGVACSGPGSAGGEVFADIRDTIGAKHTEQRIKAEANCLKEREI